jgi:hypothetical protein
MYIMGVYIVLDFRKVDILSRMLCNRKQDMKNIRNVKTNRLIPLIAAAALVAVMTASALTMTQQAYANPCSISEDGEDTAASDGGPVTGNVGPIECTFNDDVITFEPEP